MREKKKQPRAMKGKVRKHHWFKSARVTCHMEIEQRAAERERKRIKQAHQLPMFQSLKALLNSLTKSSPE